MLDAFDQIYAKEIFKISGETFSEGKEIDAYMEHLRETLSLEQIHELSENITRALYEVDNEASSITSCQNTKLPTLSNCYKVTSIV